MFFFFFFFYKEEHMLSAGKVASTDDLHCMEIYDYVNCIAIENIYLFRERQGFC